MRMRRLRAPLLVCTCVLLLAGCARRSLTPLDTAVAESYVDLLRAHRFAQIESDMSPDLRATETGDALAVMSGALPPQQPISVKVVGADTLSAPDFRSTALTLEYQFPGKWLLASVTTEEIRGNREITDLDVTPIPDSLEHRNRFSLWGKTELEYDILMLGLLSLLLSLSAFFVCLQMPLRRAKWFWLMVTLTGIGGFAVNWTTGACAATPLVLRLPVAGGSAPVYGPAMVYVAVPVGALIFLAVRKHLALRAPDAPDFFSRTPNGPLDRRF